MSRNLIRSIGFKNIDENGSMRMFAVDYYIVTDEATGKNGVFISTKIGDTQSEYNAAYIPGTYDEVSAMLGLLANGQVTSIGAPDVIRDYYISVLG